jgi:hypothetical protein
MDKAKAREVVIDLFKKYPAGVTFADIEEALEEAGIDPKGDYYFINNHNVSIWAGVAKEFIDLIYDLVNERVLIPEPAPRWVYWIAGKAPAFPVAEAIPKKGFKEPHWFPVTFKRGENFPKQ